MKLRTVWHWRTILFKALPLIVAASTAWAAIAYYLNLRAYVGPGVGGLSVAFGLLLTVYCESKWELFHFERVV